jgi:hypothetical protein
MLVVAHEIMERVNVVPSVLLPDVFAAGVTHIAAPKRGL